MLKEDRLFDPNPSQKSNAMALYTLIKDLPILSPHGHVDPALFSQENYRFGNPVDLLLKPDHYLLRMLYSQGLSYEDLLGKSDPRAVWQVFADHFYIFQGTPSDIWLTHSLEMVFGVTEKLNSLNASEIYDQIQTALDSPEFSPRKLFKKMNIEVLATTDSATDTLIHHQRIRTLGWEARIIPTFRPDEVIDLNATDWRSNINLLSEISGVVRWTLFPRPRIDRIKVCF